MIEKWRSKIVSSQAIRKIEDHGKACFSRGSRVGQDKRKSPLSFFVKVKAGKLVECFLYSVGSCEGVSRKETVGVMVAERIFSAKLKSKLNKLQQI